MDMVYHYWRDRPKTKLKRGYVKMNYTIKGNQIHIEGNFLNWYNDKTETIEGNAPISFENGSILEIDEDRIVLEMEEGFQLFEVDGVGQKELLYSK